MKPGLLSGMSFSSGISNVLSFLSSALAISVVEKCILLWGDGHLSQFASQLSAGESLGVLSYSNALF